ncbi:winged helix-turn-helix transcriptional regulator [Amycolatopsis sp. OK19-0408]|uniref:Winged helix-turn-helix transcriptional regulator n=1 Tax=Amycolatopsis iheyensis TaxID=2945988 RepID=A0A9X2N942_9PSEU|nr:winged helix-turn-helix transcriptional regulator [Amycolatopsis iheyensis]MCR6483537.1 winged helix-turn-helix transcriptional regulator [Amycolatopsis iheyensis]
MTARTRTYGQFCGLARAMELIGERWALLIVRDLVLGPKRYTELQAGLPRIPASVLSARLNEMETAGVIRRRVRPDLDAGLVYELTEYGGELDRILLDLGLWGARSLSHPGPDDVFSLDAAILSLYTTFRSDAAAGVKVTYEIQYHAKMIVHAMVDNGTLKVSEGRHADADLIIRCGAGPALLDVIGGQVSPAEAVRSGRISLEGDARDLDLFASLFRLTTAPEPQVGIVVH